MWPHFINFLSTAGRWFFTSIGTTLLGWFVESVVLFAGTTVVTLLVIRLLRGKTAMREHVKENVLISIYVFAIMFTVLWGTLFARAVIHTSFEDHEYFVGKVKQIRNQDRQDLSGTSGGLQSKIDSLRAENSSLKSELAKRKHNMVPSDSAFQNTIRVIHAAQQYREGRRSQTCVTVITAPPKSYDFALVIQQIIGGGNCAPTGPIPFDLHSDSDLEKVAMQDAQPDFITCHVAKDDVVGEKFCNDLADNLLVKISYKPLPNPEKLYRLDHGAGSEKIVWLQFGTDAEWKTEYYERHK